MWCSWFQEQHDKYTSGRYYSVINSYSGVFVMIDESLIPELNKLGMSEYEAKTYTVLLALRVASAREVHEITNIPRGRVYETLNALIEKGFVNSSSDNPARYSATDVSRTFDRLKREKLIFLDRLSTRLQNFEKERPEQVLQAYELRTAWSIDKQIRLSFARAKSEMIIICNDLSFLEKFSAEIIRTQKRIPVYPVVSDENIAEKIPVKCYLGDKDINSAFFSPPSEVTDVSTIKLVIYTDRHESLLVFERNGILEGVFLSNDIHAIYQSRTFLKNRKEI